MFEPGEKPPLPPLRWSHPTPLKVPNVSRKDLVAMVGLQEEWGYNQGIFGQRFRAGDGTLHESPSSDPRIYKVHEPYATWDFTRDDNGDQIPGAGEIFDVKTLRIHRDRMTPPCEIRRAFEPEGFEGNTFAFLYWLAIRPRPWRYCATLLPDDHAFIERGVVKKGETTFGLICDKDTPYLHRYSPFAGRSSEPRFSGELRDLSVKDPVHHYNHVTFVGFRLVRK